MLALLLEQQSVVLWLWYYYSVLGFTLSVKREEQKVH